MIDVSRKTAGRLCLVRLLACLALWTVCAGAADTADNSATIQSGCELDYPPFCIVHEDGRADGFSVELLKASLKAMGRDVTFRPGPWAEVKSWLEQGEVEVLPLVGRTPEREALFDFTVPYLTMHGCLIVRQDTTGLQNLQDLSGKRVGVMLADNAEEFLRREERDFDIVTTPSFVDALQMLAEGECDAVVMQRLVATRLLQETDLHHRLRIVEQPITAFAQDFCFAVQEGDRDMLSLLNEGLALVVADGTHRRLHAKWFAALELPPDRPLVVGGDSNNPPYEFLDDKGRPTGYNVDLMRAVALEAGLDIHIRLGPWTQILRDLENGDIDLVQSMPFSTALDQRFDFSQTHNIRHYVGVVRPHTGPPPSRVEDLEGLSLVVQEGDIMHAYALEHGLTNNLTWVPTPEDALKAVAAGQQDCALVPRITALYYKDNRKLDELHIGHTPLLSPEYGFTAQTGQNALLTQLSEGLLTLEQSGEYRKIREKWMGVYEKPAISIRDILGYVAMGVIPLLLVLMLILLWSKSLRRQVAAKTAELEASHQKLSSQYRLLDIASKTMRFGGWSVNLETGEILWSDTVAEIHGMPAGYTSNVQEGIDFYAPEWREKIKEVFTNCAEKGIPYDEEMEIISRGGKRVWVRTAGQAVRDAGGKIVAVDGSFQDITERKLQEIGLQRLNERLAAAQKIAGMGDWDWDPKTDKVSWSENLYTIMGLPADQPPPDYAGNINLYHPDDQDRFVKTVTHALETGESYSLTLRTRRPDGQENTVQAQGRVELDEDGQVTRLYGTVLDITEKRKASEQLQQAQKLESVGRLAGGVAHDFNNLLSGIMGHVELCRWELEPEHPIHEYLNTIMTDSQRSAGLVSQLMAFARKQRIEPKTIDLNESVEGILTMLRRLIGEDIDLRWQPAPTPLLVKIDPTQVDQILANLCVNARDAIVGIGTVTIEAANVTVDAETCASHPEAREGAFVRLTVNDTGCGMDRETVANIFEPFYTTKPMGQGTGLGLSTVYGIVGQNGGFVSVDSEVGKGTTFRIHLPAYEKEEEPKEEAPSGGGDAIPGGDETILIAEDEKSIRTILQRMLQKLGYTVLTASDPSEIIRIAENHPGKIDLLISDVVMPGMNGPQLVEKLKAHHPGLNVLFMSGYTADIIEQRRLGDKQIELLSKPFSQKELAHKVRKILDEA